MDIVKTDAEIDKLMNSCKDRIDEGGSKYPGMSYEQGIVMAIEWLRGDEAEHPLEEE